MCRVHVTFILLALCVGASMGWFNRSYTTIVRPTVINHQQQQYVGSFGAQVQQQQQWQYGGVCTIGQRRKFALN